MKKGSGAWVYGAVALLLFIMFYVVGKTIILVLAIVFAVVTTYWIKKFVGERKNIKEMVDLMKGLPKRKKK